MFTTYGSLARFTPSALERKGAGFVVKLARKLPHKRKPEKFPAEMRWGKDFIGVNNMERVYGIKMVGI